MALEAGTYVNDLVVTNPVGASDFISAGDDHIRLLKNVLKTTFPNASRPYYLPATTALQTADYTVTSAQQNAVIPISCEAAARTVVLSPNSTFPDGFQVTIVKADHSPNVLSIDAWNADTINGNLLIYLHQRYQSVRLTWCSTISAWIAEIQEVTPIGFISANFNNTLPPGWVWMNGTTIGNPSSGASGRANVDCLGLFTVLWNSLSNTYAPVSGGRGLTAAADFANNKLISVPNLAGYTLAGKDGMNGIGALGLLTASFFGAAGTTLGATGGSQSHTLSEAQLASHLHSISSSSASNGSHGHPTRIAAGEGLSSNVDGGFMLDSSGTNYSAHTSTTPDAAAGNQIGMAGAHTHTITSTASATGGGQAHNNVQPTMVVNYMIKL